MDEDRVMPAGSLSTVRLLARALALRCPHCGRGRVLLSWFRLRSACPVCGLKLQRNEEADYWTGGFLVNFIIAELVVASVLTFAVLVAWPDVDWSLILRGTTIAALAGPLLTWPFSRTLWLGIDLRFRPPEPADFEVPAGEADGAA